MKWICFGALQHNAAIRVGDDGDIPCERQLPKVLKVVGIDPAEDVRNDVGLHEFKQASSVFAIRLLHVDYETETPALNGG